MNNLISIVIPTFNRHRQLNRLLDYYSHYDFPILVADSSKTAFENGYESVKYYHYPGMPYSMKLPLVYSKVKTKYVLFCADDDFILPYAIKKCVEFLEKNPDYNSVHGHYVFFEDQKKSVSVYPFYLASIELDINSNKPSERVKQLLSRYMQLLYAVTKTSNIKLAFKMLRENPKIKNDNLVELFQAIILCINGKSKTLPNLYCAREVTPNSARTHTKELDVYYEKPEYRSEYRSWSETIIKHLSRKEKIPHDKTREIFDESVRLYLKNSLLYIPFLKISLTDIQRLVNKYSFGLAKKIYNQFHPSKGVSNLSKHAFSKRESKVEFKLIQSYIEKHRIERSL